MKPETALDLLNIIIPKHGRTSCSDENPRNGFFTRNELGFGRCARCIHLDIIDGEPIPAAVQKALDNDDLFALYG